MGMWLWLGCTAVTTGWVVEVRGTVLDPDWQPVADIDVSLLTEEGAWIGSATTGEDGDYGLPVVFEEEGQVSIQVHAEGHGRVAGVLHTSLLLRDLPDPIPLRVGPGQTLAMALSWVPPVVLPLEGDGLGSGRVLDAVTGEPVPRLQLSFQRGWNAPSSAAVEAWGATDSEGEFTLAEGSGVYTASAEAQSGYARTVFPVILAPEEVVYQRGFVVPPPGEPEIRGVMAWDGAVASLDLHLTGPKAGAEDDNGRYNIYEDSPTFPALGDPVAELLSTAAGSEAVAVNEHLAEGLYRLSAHDVGNAAETSGSTALSRSGALVWLWWEDEVWMETIPHSVEGTVWRALELEVSDGTLTRLHTFDDSTTGEDQRAF